MPPEYASIVKELCAPLINFSLLDRAVVAAEFYILSGVVITQGLRGG